MQPSAVHSLLPKEIVAGEITAVASGSDERKAMSSTSALQFIRARCLQCHQESPESESSSGIPLIDLPHKRWNQVWLRMALFDHQKHPMSCTDCHKMESRLASDVLIPHIDACKKCHSSLRSETSEKARRGPSDCVTCHHYHGSGNRFHDGPLRRDSGDTGAGDNDVLHDRPGVQ
jgi:hypothetical protein